MVNIRVIHMRYELYFYSPQDRVYLLSDLILTGLTAWYICMKIIYGHKVDVIQAIFITLVVVYSVNIFVILVILQMIVLFSIGMILIAP